MPLAAGVLGVLVPVLVLGLSGTHMVMFHPGFHLAVVGLAGTLALVAAAALSVAAARRRDGRAVLLGFAFSVMAMLLTIHALASPGVLLGDNGLVQLTGALNLPIGGLILSAGAFSIARRPIGVRSLLRLQGAVLAGIALLGTIALIAGGVVPLVPRPSSATAFVIFALGAACLLPLVWRASRTFLLTRRTADLLVASGVLWMIGAEYGLLHFTMMDAGWWAAHALEVGGIALIAVPAVLDLRYATTSRPLIGDLRAADLVENEEAFLGGRVRALMVRLGEKDPSTEGHTRRVAALAVQIGEELGLPATRLRLLALGGLLHDMGKLRVPDEILVKPGRLTAEEFDVIRHHPVWGRELLDELGGFTPLMLRLVEAHHERLDGKGYPHGETADTLELEVRILTAADVYDALTADRVYRGAMSQERAFEIIDADTGAAFDPICVQALRVAVGAPKAIGAAPAATGRAGAHTSGASKLIAGHA